MLSSKWKVAAVLAGLMLAPALSYAQGPGGGRGRGGFGGGFGRGGSSISGLLRMEEVQKEISVTDEQKAALEKAAEERRAQFGQGGQGSGFNFGELQNLSEEERNKRMEEFRKTMEESQKKSDEQIKAILKPEQVARLNQLRVQQEGLGALNREEVQKELGLSEEQVGKIKAATEARNARGSAPAGVNFQDLSEDDLRKMREEREARVKKYDEEMKAVLTADQTAAFEKMKGAEFKFPAGGGFGGPGGGRGGRGGPGGGGRPRPE